MFKGLFNFCCTVFFTPLLYHAYYYVEAVPVKNSSTAISEAIAIYGQEVTFAKETLPYPYMYKNLP